VTVEELQTETSALVDHPMVPPTTTRITEESHASRRADDILDVNLITSYFAYVNRIADGPGIALEGRTTSSAGDQPARIRGSLAWERV
jgi:hypothetical protein